MRIRILDRKRSFSKIEIFQKNSIHNWYCDFLRTNPNRKNKKLNNDILTYFFI